MWIKNSHTRTIGFQLSSSPQYQRTKQFFFLCMREPIPHHQTEFGGMVCYFVSLISHKKLELNRHVIRIQESCQPVKQSDSCRLRAGFDLANIFSLEIKYNFQICWLKVGCHSGFVFDKIKKGEWKLCLHRIKIWAFQLKFDMSGCSCACSHKINSEKLIFISPLNILNIHKKTDRWCAACDGVFFFAFVYNNNSCEHETLFPLLHTMLLI